MAKPKRQRESKVARADEYQIGASPLVLARRQADMEAGWPTAVPNSAATEFAEEIELRVNTARRDSLDKDLGDPVSAARSITSALPAVIEVAAMLYVEYRQAAPIRTTSQVQQIRDIAAFTADARAAVGKLIIDAPTARLRTATKEAKRHILKAVLGEIQVARARPVRTTRIEDSAPRALLVSLGWWWRQQDWTPTTHEGGCYLLVAGKLEELRGKAHAFARPLVKLAVDESLARYKKGPFPEIIQLTGQRQ